MGASKLILVEGIPGTGKSSTAQTIARWLEREGIRVKWWYEEEKGHPVYVFQNEASLELVLRDLKEGNFEALRKRALEQWTLFAGQVCDSRGAGTEARFVRQAVDSVYGQRHGLEGFAGLIDYWKNYQSLCLQWLQPLQMEKLYLQRAEVDDETGLAKISAFLERAGLPKWITPSESSTLAHPDLTGEYTDSDKTCTIRLEIETYRKDGFGSPIWPNTRLIPLGAARFQLASLPITAEFLTNPHRLGAAMLVELHDSIELHGPYFINPVYLHDSVELPGLASA